MQQISAPEAAELLSNQPDKVVLLDIREAAELEVVAIEGVLHIPMGEIPARLDEIDSAKTIICLCHSGGRSAQVTEFLLGQGFSNTVNLTGGIQAWCDLVDASIQKY